MLHTGAWIALAVGLLIAAFNSHDGPTYLAAAVTAAYLAVGAWTGNILYFAIFSPVFFFGIMFLSMFVILSFGR
jgi:hypothetical protein